MIGDNRGLAEVNRSKEITIRNQTHALIPRVVGRIEVSINVVIGAKSLTNSTQDLCLDLFWLGTCAVIKEFSQRNVLGSGDRISGFLRQDLAKSVGDRIVVGS